MQLEQHTVEIGKNAVDVLSIVGVVSTVIGWLPAATAFLSLIWVGMRIYETGLNIQAKRKK